MRAHAQIHALARSSRSSRLSPICLTSFKSARCVCAQVYRCLLGCVFVYQLIALKQNLGEIAVPAQPSLQRIHSNDSELAYTVKRLRAGNLLHESIDGRVGGSNGGGVGGAENMVLAGRERGLQKAWEEDEVLFVLCVCVFVVFPYSL